MGKEDSFASRRYSRRRGKHCYLSLIHIYNTDLKRYEDAEKAADAFFNASDRADYSYLDYRYYGALLSALKKYDKAIIEYGKALDKDDTQVDLWREISDAHEMNNNYAEAIAAYRKYYDALAKEKKTPEKMCIRDR